VQIVALIAAALRKHPRVTGIRINGKMFKIVQYADDTCLYLSDEDSLKNAFI
jgi:hypothetical protein